VRHASDSVVQHTHASTQLHTLTPLVRSLVLDHDAAGRQVPAEHVHLQVEGEFVEVVWFLHVEIDVFFDACLCGCGVHVRVRGERSSDGCNGKYTYTL
jgi:hypothetical protein